MINPRILRKRWFLGVIFGFSLIYFLISISKQSELSVVPERPRERRPLEAFQWQALEDPANATGLKTCRNSVQGKALIADDKGYVCERKNVKLGGCCDVDASSSERYMCSSCQNNGCCKTYEHCVSCCMQPEKQPLLRKILGQAVETFQNLYNSVADQYELCLAKCRTSSQSVQHENSYRDPLAKFCYGENPPALQPSGLL